jgi:4-amino-4-deoxy-L-arabinose transferase-like glycosyltransferase
VLGFRLGTAPVEDAPEQRPFQVAQTMLASGDWGVPRLAGEPRLNKPPLYYWAVAATAKAFAAGEVTPTVLRLPAALSALTLVALTFAWGRWIGGATHGLFAAILLVGMHGFIVFGRRGVADMPLTLFCGAALLCYEHLRATRRAALLPVFATCVALAVLAKATVALLVIGLPIGLDLLLRGDLRTALRPRVLAWVGAALVAGFGWYGFVIARVPGAWDTLMMALLLPVGVESTAVEITNTHYHPSPLYYLGRFPKLALPALLLLPFALVRAWRTRLWRGDAARRFPALAFAALFVAFSLVLQKQPHYLLPLLPLLALVLAEPLAHAVATRPAVVQRWRRLE